MIEVSLDEIAEREHALHYDAEREYYEAGGINPGTPTDRFMEINDDRMGIDSEESTMREKRSSKLLQKRPIPYYIT